MNRGHDLRTLGELTERHHGKHIEVAGLGGLLVGLLPVGDRIQVALIVGSARVFSDALAADTEVHVERKVAVQ